MKRSMPPPPNPKSTQKPHQAASNASSKTPLLPSETQNVPIQKLIEETSQLISTQLNAAVAAASSTKGSQIAPFPNQRFLTILKNYHLLDKLLEDETHFSLVMKHRNALFLNVLMQQDPGSMQASSGLEDQAATAAQKWSLLKSECLHFMGNLFEFNEMTDEDSLLALKGSFMKQMIEKEDLLGILGRIAMSALDEAHGGAALDAPLSTATVTSASSTQSVNTYNFDAFTEFVEDRKQVYGLLKVWNAMIQLLGVDYMVQFLLKTQKRRQLASSRKSGSFTPPQTTTYTYAFKIFLFLKYSLYAIWKCDCELTELERADIFLYTSEMLNSFLQESEEMKELFSHHTHMEIFPQLIELYIERSKPKIMSEMEGFSHVMNSLCSCLTVPQAQQLFNGEHKTQKPMSGVQLVMRLIKKHKFAREAGIRVLLYALNSSSADDTSSQKETMGKFIHNYKGIKLLFALFMKSLSEKAVENLIELLVLVVDFNDPSIHMRFIGKFKEKSFEKTDRLVELFLKYNDRLEQFDNEIKNGKYVSLLIEVEQIQTEEQLEERIMSDRLTNGLYMLRLISKIVGYVCEESVRKRIMLHLKPRNLSLDDIAEILEEYVDFLPSEGQEEEEYRCKILIKFLKAQTMEEKQNSGGTTTDEKLQNNSS